MQGRTRTAGSRPHSGPAQDNSNKPHCSMAISTIQAHRESAPEPRRRSRSSSSGRPSRGGYARHSRRSSQRMALALGLMLSLGALAVLAIFSYVVISGLKERASTFEVELAARDAEIARLKPEVTELREKLTAVLQKRLANLQTMEADKVIPIVEGYVKNIVFTPVKHAGKTEYEYKLVLENLSEDPVQPKARVLVFNDYGVQIGVGLVSDNKELMSGESRSYSNTIDLFLSDTPAYFTVATDG